MELCTHAFLKGIIPNADRLVFRIYNKCKLFNP